MVLPKLILEPNFLSELGIVKNSDNVIDLNFGAGMGLGSNLEAGVSLPLFFAPKIVFGTIGFYGMYDLTDLIKKKIY